MELLAEGGDVKVHDVINHVGVPPVEAFFAHFGDCFFFVPVLDNDAVDGADGSGTISPVKAVNKGGTVLGIEENF